MDVIEPIERVLAGHPELEVAPPSSMGDAVSRLSEAQGIDADLALAMRRAVGFRNLAVHNDDAIDWAIFFAIATQHLDDFLHDGVRPSGDVDPQQ